MNYPVTVYSCPMSTAADGGVPSFPPYPNYPTIKHIPDPKPEWKFCPHCGKELDRTLGGEGSL